MDMLMHALFSIFCSCESSVDFPVVSSRVYKAVSPVLAIASQCRQLVQRGKLH